MSKKQMHSVGKMQNASIIKEGGAYTVFASQLY